MVTIHDNPIAIKCGNFERPCEVLEPLTHMTLALSSCIAKNLKKYYSYNSVDTSLGYINVSYTNEQFLTEFYLIDDSYFNIVKNFIDTITILEPCTMVKMISTQKRFLIISDNNIVLYESEV